MRGTIEARRMSELITKGRHLPLERVRSEKVVSLDRARTPEAGSNSARHLLVRIHLLGSMRATTYLGEDILPRGRKARAILACLCLAAGERIPRARLATLLWDRVPDHQARKSLRQSLRELTRAMGPLATELISANRETIRLDTDHCWIDALALLAPQPSAPNSLRSDLAGLCSGELLEELEGASPSFDQWLLGERTRFTEQLRTLLEAELVQLTQSGHDPSKQASAARRLIAFDSTHEGAARALMRALSGMGERAQAIRAYERCREALKKTLDVEPSRATQALYKAIRALADRGDRDKRNPASTLPPEQSFHRHPSTSPNRLRVGVLPFMVTGPSRHGALAFSLSQEIAAALSRFRWFDVIAPISLSRRSSESPVAEEVLKRKQLDYVIDGALSGNGRQFQISVRLLDLTADARPVWSERFKLGVGALHQVDELITARIVGQIDPVILFIEGQPKRREHYGATGLLLLAMPLMYSLERKKYEEAGKLIESALAIDPNNAMVSAWAAHWQIYYVGQGWAQDGARALTLAQEHARRAMNLDPDNAEALGIYAHVCAFLDKDFDAAQYYFDRALRLNPNLAFIWALSALTYSYIGEPDAALQRLARYRDLSPFDPYPYIYENPYTVAYTIKGDYEQAVIVGRRVVNGNPDFVNGYKPLIAALGHLGRRKEAKPYIDKLLSLEPNFSMRSFRKVYPFKHAVDRERYIAGLRKAGVPER
jgi:DNA-binding SARP family transcriptional activator/Tfp pilus assembly protein PilF